MKILINALSGVGDAIMFSPSLRLIKSALPYTQIDMLVMFQSVKEMYSRNPYVDNIYHIDFLHQSKIKSLKEIYSLRKNGYDYSVNVYPSNRFEYNFLNYLLGAKKRFAHHYLHTKFSRAEFLNTFLIQEVKNKHNVLQNISFAKMLTRSEPVENIDLEIFLSEDDDTNADKWISENGLNGKFLVGFHCGSAVLKNHINKRWAKEKFAELGKKLMNKYSAKILLFGNEFELNNEINAMMDNKAVIVSTSSYIDSMARLKRCKLFVTNDTAFMHSAAAFKIYSVCIFGYTNHKELHPWNSPNIIVRKKLDCSPCFYNSPEPANCKWKGADEFKCIKTIEINEVYEACKKMISAKKLSSENPIQS